MVYIGRYFGPMGGFGWGPHGGLGPMNNTVNINLGGGYPCGGGMYNFNNWTAPRPFHRTRFERFWDNFDRGMRSLAPIGLGVAGFFALFGKNGVLKNDKTKDTDNGKSKVNPKDEKPKVNTSTKDSNVSSTEKDVKDKISEHAKKYFEMLNSKEYRQVAQNACEKMINKGGKYKNAVMKNEDGTYTINQLALCADKDVADAWKEAFKDATKECGYPDDKFKIESLVDEKSVKELQEKYKDDETKLKTLEELGIKVPGFKETKEEVEKSEKKK